MMIHHCPICNLAVDPEVQRGTGATLGYWCAEHGFWTIADIEHSDLPHIDMDAIFEQMQREDDRLPFDEWEANDDA